jgi:hypothetical protein
LFSTDFFVGYKGGEIYWLAIHCNQANLIGQHGVAITCILVLYVGLKLHVWVLQVLCLRPWVLLLLLRNFTAARHSSW